MTNKKSVDGNIKRNPKQIIPELIVKFVEGGDITVTDGNLVGATHISLNNFQRIVGSVKGAVVRPSFPNHREKLNAMRLEAEKNLKRSIPNLNLFFRIKVGRKEDLDVLIQSLNKLPEIEYATRGGIIGPPPLAASGPWTDEQDHMDPAPIGVNAPYAWLYPKGKGDGVTVVDCEMGFCEHEDLPPINNVSTRETDLTIYESHGTAVLGILVGIHDPPNNDKGINGICPNVTMLFSSESRTGDPVDVRDECIADAVVATNPGDIILLEMQFNGPDYYDPAEWSTVIHSIILTAVGCGRIVIEAAANGNGTTSGQQSQNLNKKTNCIGKNIWDPNSADFDDSLAIIVGAGKSNESGSTLNEKTDKSNFGDRVDCHAWGEFVRTTGGSGNLQGPITAGGAYDPTIVYTSEFAGTSSATAIVAGVAACLQAAAIEAGVPLTPPQMRDILREPMNGTPQTNGPTYSDTNYHIGPMPDLKKLFCAAGIQADVYMRDHVDDNGEVPFEGPHLYQSPDIIPRKNPVAVPHIEFGVAHWDETDLGENIEYGQDNYIYVRMHNRGNVPDDVSIHLYWSNSAGFIHPSTWNLIGILPSVNVNAGEHKVAGPIIWSKGSIQQNGHFCLIAVVNSERDPITIPTAFTSTADYLDFVRNNNNICYRNIWIEDVIPDAVPPLPLMLIGLPELTGYHNLEIKHHLPIGAEIMVQINKRIPKYNQHIKYKKGKKNIYTTAPYTRLKNFKGRPLRVEEIPLKKGENVKTEIQINLPKDTTPGNYLIHANQYFKEKYLGRVNYKLRVKAQKKK